MLTIKVVEGHDDVQVGSQESSDLVDEGRIVGWVNSHMVPRLVPAGGREEGSGSVLAGGGGR